MQIQSLDKQYLDETIILLNRIFPEQDEEENVDTCFRASLDYEAYSSVLQRWKIPKLEYFIALQDGKVVGTSGIYEMLDDPQSAWVGWTSVAPEYRRQGIGKQLILHTMHVAKSRNYTILKLHTVDIDSQKNAHALYESVGFKFISREKEREIGHDRLYYELLL